ncbi:MAG: glycosyl hydrolase family 28 protein [Opitutales bacterium]
MTSKPAVESPEATTRWIQHRIDAVSADGGGRVVIPPGRWCCGSLQMKSGVELQLESGAVLMAADDPSLFPSVGENDPGVTANQKLPALLWARNAEHISITGPGRVDGGGDPDATPDWHAAQNRFRPAVTYLENCRNVRIRDVEFANAKWWTLHLRRCSDICIRGIHIDNTWPNSDGIDPDGCRDLMISDSRLRCGDDCIVLKSTGGGSNENVVITNCILETAHACFKLGTESLGSFRNILLSNSVLRGSVAVGLYNGALSGCDV